MNVTALSPRSAGIGPPPGRTRQPRMTGLHALNWRTRNGGNEQAVTLQ
jgi:hypothetical protein